MPASKISESSFFFHHRVISFHLYKKNRHVLDIHTNDHIINRLKRSSY
jgi:hypothetical protein